MMPLRSAWGGRHLGVVWQRLAKSGFSVGVWWVRHSPMAWGVTDPPPPARSDMECPTCPACALRPDAPFDRRWASAGGGTLIRLQRSASRVPPPLAVSRAQTCGTLGSGGSYWGHLPMVAHLVRGQGAAARRSGGSAGGDCCWRCDCVGRQGCGEGLPLSATRRDGFTPPLLRGSPQRPERVFVHEIGVTRLAQGY